MDNYILDERGEPVPVADVLEWARWFEGGGNRRRRVAATPMPWRHQRFSRSRAWGYVSTVFLGLDHSFGLGGPPVLWETMVFGGRLDDLQWRYTSQRDARRGHWRAVALALLALALPTKWARALERRVRP